MRMMGLQAICQAPRTTGPHPEHRAYAYLLKGVTNERSNHVWSADTRYIPVQRGFLVSPIARTATNGRFVRPRVVVPAPWGTSQPSRVFRPRRVGLGRQYHPSERMATPDVVTSLRLKSHPSSRANARPALTAFLPPSRRFAPCRSAAGFRRFSEPVSSEPN